MAYLNVDPDLFEHRKTRRLRALLGDGSEVFVLRLWAYCARFHAQDGHLADYTFEEIESLAGWRGEPQAMLQAMLKVGFLDQGDSGVVVHDWKEHQGHIAAYKERGRMMAQRRWAKARDAASNATSNAASIPDSNATGNAGPPPPAMLLPTVPTVPTKPTVPVCVPLAVSVPPEHDHPPEGTHTDSIWPTLDEVLKRAELRAIPEECARKWWLEHDARGGCDRHGQPLKRWESALTAFAASWRAVDAQRKARDAPRLPAEVREPSNHTKGFWK